MPGDSRVEITCIAYADPAETKRIGDPPAGLPFSPGVLAGDTLRSAADLGAVIDFYNERFGAGIVGTEKEDLIAFLRTL